MAAAVLGVLVGTLLVLGLGALDTTIRTEDDLRVLELPILGVVPKAHKTPRGTPTASPAPTGHEVHGPGRPADHGCSPVSERKDSPEAMSSSSTSSESLLNTSLATVSRNGRALAPTAAHGALVLLAAPRSPAAEAYRSLAAAIQFAAPEGRVQVVGVTSAEAGEGKSTAAANLALALAEGGRQVIIIDADLRRPVQHTLFGIERTDGLANLLRTDAGPLSLIDTGVPGITLLPAGPLPGNPLEALASSRFDEVLAQARTRADFVIVDTAPAGALADAAVCEFLPGAVAAHPMGDELAQMFLHGLGAAALSKWRSQWNECRLSSQSSLGGLTKNGEPSRAVVSPPGRRKRPMSRSSASARLLR